MQVFVKRQPTGKLQLKHAGKHGAGWGRFHVVALRGRQGGALGAAGCGALRRRMSAAAAAAPPRQDLPLILDLDEEARSSESAEPRRKRAKRLPERFREPPAGAASTGASPRAPAARPALTSAGSGANEARISQTTIRVRKGNVRGAISPRAGAVGVHTLAGSKAAGSSAPRIRLVIRRPGAHSGVLLKDELVSGSRQGAPFALWWGCHSPGTAVSALVGTLPRRHGDGGWGGNRN